MSINDGGPYHTLILPTKAVNGVVTENNVHPGASLRDHFAGLAMQGILSRGGDVNRSFEDVAKKAFRYADAMLAEKGRGR